MTVTEVETPAARVARLREQLRGFSEQSAQLRSLLDQAEDQRQAALRAGDDTREHARRCRELRAELDAIDGDRATVAGWLATAQREVERERLAAEYRRLTDELEAAQAGLTEWAAGVPAALDAAIGEVRQAVERLIGEVSAVRARHDTAAGLHAQLVGVAGLLGLDAAGPVPDPVEPVAKSLDNLLKRRLFMAALRGRTDDALTVIGDRMRIGE